MKEMENSVINSNSIWDLTKDIIYSFIENTIYFIEELEGDQKEFEEAILIEDLPEIEKENTKIMKKTKKKR